MIRPIRLLRLRAYLLAGIAHARRLTLLEDLERLVGASIT